MLFAFLFAFTGEEFGFTHFGVVSGTVYEKPEEKEGGQQRLKKTEEARSSEKSKAKGREETGKMFFC